ncbi:MAG: NAD-dependent epimerase/dehydratase family protein [Pseudomonadota bacterium]
MTTRRDFLAAGAAALATAGCRAPEAGDEPEPPGDSAPLSILILGGTGFIGPHMVELALGRGHSVTLFNRGRTNAGLFPDVETLIGDRDGQLDALEGRRFDAVIDNSGYVPRHVRDSAALLSGQADQYLFISSISAYADFAKPGITEDYAVGTMSDETVETVTGETYGPMKALCEAAVRDSFAGRAAIVRPGYIVGPGDRTDRWTYWPLRVAAGGSMLAPGAADDPVQFIDARDLAAFVVGLLERRTAGTFNAVGPTQPMAFGGMLETMRDVTGAATEFVWVDADKLEANGVQVPIWSPPAGEFAGVHQVDNARALGEGLTFTPLADTVRDTLSWWRSLEADRRAGLRAGLSVAAAADGRPAPLSLEERMAQEAELLDRLRDA